MVKLKTSVLLLTIISIFAFTVSALALPTKMPSGFYYPTDRTDWTGNDSGLSGDPKQPWDDKGTGGQIYGYMDRNAASAIKKNHVGMDIRQPYNSPVYAIADGIIDSYANSEDPRYWCIIVKHRTASGEDFYAVYGHCRLAEKFAVGSSVKAGDTFAYVNESVNQHMHFGIKLNNDFSTGWGHLELGIDPESVGWRPPRTWLMSNAPYGVK